MIRERTLLLDSLLIESFGLVVVLLERGAPTTTTGKIYI